MQVAQQMSYTFFYCKMKNSNDTKKKNKLVIVHHTIINCHAKSSVNHLFAQFERHHTREKKHSSSSPHAQLVCNMIPFIPIYVSISIRQTQENNVKMWKNK